MFINKEGKLFDKISIIDLIVIVAVVIAGFGIYSRYINPNQKVTTVGQQIEYTIQIKNVRTGTVEALKNKGLIYNFTTKELMGEIADVKETTAVEDTELSNGNIKNIELPEKFDVLLTIKVAGKVNSSGYYTTENQPISVGSSHVLVSKYAKVEGKVMDIREVK